MTDRPSQPKPKKKKPQKTAQPVKTIVKAKERSHEVGSLPTEEDQFNSIVEFYPFSPQQIQALQEYQKDLDFDRACKAVGLSANAKKNLKDPTRADGQAFLKEMMEIQKEYQVAIKLNANSSAVKHLELLQKFEADYDTADINNQNKGSLASTLAKMSDTSLKATGQFNNGEMGGGMKVEINIDLGTNAPEQLDIEDAIEGKIVKDD
mgnify:CR=1 FL=1